MARPIGLEVAPRDPREELRKRLEEAPEQHAEALLESYELLQHLHDSGVLRLLRGAVSSGGMILDAVVGRGRFRGGHSRPAKCNHPRQDARCDQP